MTLQEFFLSHPKAAIAFSGGVDSVFLLWAAKQYGCDVHAYYVHTAFQPAFEVEDARKAAAQIGVPITMIEADVLSVPMVQTNGHDRCYHCKQFLFTNLWSAARADGYSVLLDGTNASDDAGDRPGMQALRELDVRSPLRICGLTKADIRVQSKAAGLFTWDKPAYACLATRIPAGTAIAPETLQKIEHGETLLFGLGFRNFRIRLHGQAAVLQFTAEQQVSAWEKRDTIRHLLSPLFPVITLDLASRASSD